MRPPLISLLCIPGAGASAAMYGRWRRLLPEWISLVPVELPGRGSRTQERPIEDFNELVALLRHEQAPVLSGRYALFGHGMGALLAYGMALQQRAHFSSMPRALFVSACPAPSQVGHGSLSHRQGDASSMSAMAEADERVCHSYKHAAQTPLPLSVHVFGAHQGEIAAEQMSGWRYEAGGKHSIEWFDGDAHFLRRHEGPVLAAIVRALVQQFSGIRQVAPHLVQV